jgi:hypothetical protein
MYGNYYFLDTFPVGVGARSASDWKNSGYEDLVKSTGSEPTISFPCTHATYSTIHYLHKLSNRLEAYLLEKKNGWLMSLHRVDIYSCNRVLNLCSPCLFILNKICVIEFSPADVEVDISNLIYVHIFIHTSLQMPHEI